MDENQIVKTLLEELVDAKLLSQMALTMVTALRQTLSAHSPGFDKEYQERMDSLLQSTPARLNPGVTLEAVQAMLTKNQGKEGAL